MFGENLYQCFSGHRRRCPRSPPLLASAISCSSPASPIVFRHFNFLFDPDTTTTVLPLSTSSAGEGVSVFTSSFSSCDGLDGGGGSSCPSERDLSTAIASRRLLPASPGLSNSIADSPAALPVAFGVAGVAASAVHTYSPDPYGDFRRSMEEMVTSVDLDAAGHHRRLHELLLCYLALNRKHAHKYIVSAFADLLLALAAGDSVDAA